MIDAPLAYAFGVGMVAAFNPCGFAMLPAYLSYFLGLEGAAHPDERASVLRALAVGLTVTAGFLVVFGVLGIALKGSLDAIQERLPWVTIVLGVGLVVLGGWFLSGRTIRLPVAKSTRGATDRELWSMFGFGVSYALVSLSCTIPTFLIAVTATFEQSNLISGVAVYLAYGLGMGLVLMVLTMAIALAEQGLVRNLRTVLPYVNRVSGALLVLAGAYVAYYGWYELRVQDGDTSGGALAERVFDLNGDVTGWIQDVGPVRIGLLLTTVVVGAIFFVAFRRSRRDASHLS
jgi:cytochrome c biogenesis protein CcdA